MPPSKRASPGTVLAKAPWHRGDYGRRSAELNRRSNANPTTRCARCHLTLTEAKRKWGSYVRWTAGHVNRAEVGGALRPECSHCASQEGARIRNTQAARSAPLRRAERLNTSRQW